MTPALSPIPQEQYALAIISVEEAAFPEMRRFLAPTFKTTLANTEEQIKAVVEDPAIHAILSYAGDLLLWSPSQSDVHQ
jgi:hypothetical protein